MRQKTKRLFFYSAWLARYSFWTAIYLLVSLPLRLSKKYKDLWLISERPDEARDNGYWLYDWILQNKPETNIRFVLSKDSPDYEKMPRKDLIIRPNSAMHYICHILCSYSISTHMHGACPGKSFCIPYLWLMRKKKTVFLQHGITKDRINLRGGMDLVIAASEQEKKLLVSANPKYRSKVSVTGFCRYDGLKDSSSNGKQPTILVMPTFRKWLRDVARLKDADRAFTETDYFQSWNEFLNDERLAELLKTKNARLLFFPHKEMQGLAKNFRPRSRFITIGKPGEYDVQSLLKSSSVLVTDYSSVLFDFVYMKKPVLFYQFDQDDFFAKHYKSSGKPYPFGDILFSKDSLISELASTLDRNCKLKKQYLEDSNVFFKYRDTNNCRRVFDVIVRLK